MNFYVYKIINLVNGKIYVGKSSDAQGRWTEHRKIAQHPESENYSLIHKAISKYGEQNFSFEIIEILDSEECSFEREKYWISFYKTNVSEYGSKFGYNLTEGGEGSRGYRFSEEQRKKKSESQQGEKNSFFGKRHTDKAKLSMSQKKKEYLTTHPNNFLGKHHSDETKKLLSTIHIGMHAGEKNPMYGKTHTDESKNIMSQKKTEKFDFYSEINRGSNNPQSKLTEEKVMVIKKLIVEGKSNAEIASLFSVSRRLINGIKNGTNWAHVHLETS